MDRKTYYVLVYHNLVIVNTAEGLQRIYLLLRQLSHDIFDYHLTYDFNCVQHYVLKGNPIPNSTFLHFVNTKIGCNIDILDYKTLSVLKRIATGMINKMQDNKEITAEQNKLLWKVLISNIDKAKKEWVEYENTHILKIPF